MEISRRVAAFVAGIDPDEIPEIVRHEAKRSLLNFFGTALEGTHDSAVETAFATMRDFAGPAQARLIGRRARLSHQFVTPTIHALLRAVSPTTHRHPISHNSTN